MEEILKTSPFEGMPAPKVPKQLIQPFNGDQLRKLLEAAGKSSSSRRDTCLLLLLLDTGMRVGEDEAEELQGWLEWAGEGFNPAHFDLELANRRLRLLH